MSTDRIPDSVLNKITGLMRKFFWGALEKDKYLAYVAWSKIVLPRGMGGLGIRDLAKVNDALIMKLLWKMASGNSALWVGIARAKYIPRSELWSSKRTYKCTSCWRAIMAAREKLLPCLVWRIGDGRSCNAVAQKWFNGVPTSQILTEEQKSLCVRDLVHEGSGLWNVELIIQLFGHQNCLTILANVQPPREEAERDKLIFSDSTSGDFSVKLAYKRITHNNQAAHINRVCNLIWKKGDVLPRIRVFFWKLMHGALPLAKILASRISRGDPTCAVCKQGEEDVMHLLFSCPFARGCWLLGPLALRTDTLPQTISSILEMLDQQMTEEVWTNAANQAWAIWRCRNEMVYEGQVPTFDRFKLFLNKVCMETRIAAAAGKNCGSGAGVVLDLNLNPDKACCCKIDGSWKPPWRGGLGFIVEEGHELKGYRAAPSYVCCPIQAEAVALRDAILFVKEQGILSCTFYTDNEYLVVTCSTVQPPLEADWRAYKEINEIWCLLRDNDYDCKHFPRSQNVMADNLAKIGSCLEEGYTGFSYPTFKQ